MAAPLSIDLDDTTITRLGNLARRKQRSASALAAEVLARYVEAEEAHIADVEAGMAELNAGKGIDHQEVAAWLETWGTPRETDPPK